MLELLLVSFLFGVKGYKGESAEPNHKPYIFNLYKPLPSMIKARWILTQVKTNIN